MSKTELRKLMIENRIALLESRTQKDNGRIVAKLKRELKNLKTI